jgi:hypothetical protein
VSAATGLRSEITRLLWLDVNRRPVGRVVAEMIAHAFRTDNANALVRIVCVR